MDADFTFSFGTVGLTGKRIHDAQGAAHISPLNGDRLAAVPGIVTALRTNGFYFQDPQPDTDPHFSAGAHRSMFRAAASCRIVCKGRLIFYALWLRVINANTYS